jgi:hypothetical protein
VLPFDSRPPRRADRARHRLTPELLEPRTLMAFSPTGFSLPDLTITGSAAPVATWSGPLGLHMDVRNIGASSTIEPLALAPGSASGADSAPTTVDVYVSPRLHSAAKLKVATINIPSIPQNSDLPLDEVISLPPQPHGFPGDGGKVFITLRVDPGKQSLDLDRTNNSTIIRQAVQIAAPLPDLQAISMDAPPVIQPGDSVQVNAKIANYGTVDTSPQGPVTVDLVASTDTNFGPGDVVLAQVKITDIAPLSEVPATNSVLGDVNITNPVNVSQISFPVVTLPGAPPATYFLGIMVDPTNSIRQIRNIGTAPSDAISPVVSVGPPIANLPPAGVVSAPAPIANVFPIPPFGQLTIFSNTGQTLVQTAAFSGTVSTTTNGILPAARRATLLARVAHVPQGTTVNPPGNLRSVKTS